MMGCPGLFQELSGMLTLVVWSWGPDHGEATVAVGALAGFAATDVDRPISDL